MGVSWWLVLKDLVSRFIIKKRSRSKIDQINSMKNTISPKNHMNIWLEFQSSSYIKNMLMLSFYNSILLRSFNTRNLMNNTMTRIERREKKFSTISRPYNLDLSRKLSLNILRKRRNNVFNFIFGFHEINPSIFAMIIDNSKKVLMAMNIGSSKRTPGNKMNQIKTSKRMTGTKRKR